MSTITREFTKEQLIEHLKKQMKQRELHIASPATDRRFREYLELEIATNEIALTSLEAEPVADIVAWSHPSEERTCDIRWRRFDVAPGLLYTAPPALVVPDLKELEAILDWILMLPCPTPKATHMAKRLKVAMEACHGAMLQGDHGNAQVIPDWQAEAEKMAELHGSSFVVFRNGESPQCADSSKVIITFTDEGLGHGSAAPQQEVEP